MDADDLAKLIDEYWKNSDVRLKAQNKADAQVLQLEEAIAEMQSTDYTSSEENNSQEEPKEHLLERLKVLEGHVNELLESYKNVVKEQIAFIAQATDHEWTEMYYKTTLNNLLDENVRLHKKYGILAQERK